MKFTTPARRLLAAGAVSALAAGTLVGATTTSAQAVEVTNEYICVGGSSPFPLTLVSDIPILAGFPSIGAGFDADAGLLDVVNTFTVPESVVTIMQGAGVTTLESPDFAGSIGATTVAIEGVVATVASGVDNGETWTFDANGLNTAFQVPAAGTYDVLSPEGFSVLAKNSNDATILSVTCDLATAGTNGAYSSIVVTKNASTSNATAVNSPVKKGDVAKIKVKVAAPNEVPSGKVLLKKGTKTLTKGMLNENGIVILKTKALPVGKTKLTTAYKGDGYTKPSRDTVVFTVKR